MQVSDCKPVGVEVDGGGISPLDGLRFGDRYRGSELGEPPPGCQSLERKVMQFGSLLCSSLVLALTASLSPLPSGIDLVIITILLFSHLPCLHSSGDTLSTTQSSLGKTARSSEGKDGI